MRLRPLFVVSLPCLLVAASAAAQNEQTIPAITPPAGTAKGASFDEQFVDQGNLQAKELAARENISIGEATRRLRLEHNAAKAARRLAQQYPDTFGGMEVDPNSSGIRFKAHFVGGSSPENRGKIATASSDPEVTSSTDVVSSALSVSAVKQLGASLVQQIRRASIEADVGVDPFTGRVTFLAKDSGALRNAISQGSITAPADYAIEQSNGIVSTTTLIAGAAWNAPYGNAALCTTGFAVIYNSVTKGISTAGHCDINSPAEYNATFSSMYGNTGGVPLTFKQEWTSNNVDFQWHTASSSNPISPEFWEGSTSVTVSGVAQSLSGETLCKFGRTTYKTCAKINSQWFFDKNGYGYFLRLDNTAPGAFLTKEGDSGGPVFSGSIAKGWIHGRDDSGNAYYMPVTELYNNVPGMQVLCIC